MIKLSPHNGFVLVDSLLGLLLTAISLAILLLIFTSSKTFGVNNSQTQLYQLATSYGEALQTININNWHNLVLEQDDFTELYNSTAPNSSDTLIRSTLESYNLNPDKLPVNTKIIITAKIANINNVAERLIHAKITAINTKSNENIYLDKYYLRDLSSKS